MSCFQILAETTHATGIRVFLRRNSQHGFEHPLQMKWALMKLFAELRQRNWLVQVLLDVTANRLNQLLPRISRDRLWPAAQALTVSGALSFLRTTEEGHVFAPWPFRGTRWPAVHTCRRYGEHESA